MSDESFKKVMVYLDVIEAELGKISVIQGGSTFKEWMVSHESTEII